MGSRMTSKESIAHSLIFDRLGKSPFNHDIDDCIAIAARAPRLEEMHRYVNSALQEMAIAGRVPFEICYFKAGDRKIWHQKFPVSLSIETVRQAWIKSGMRRLQLLSWRKKQRRKLFKITH